MDDFICRYKETFTRQECRDIIQEIEFFEETQRLFRTEQNPHLQDQKSINVNVDFEVNFASATRVNKLMFPKLKTCVDQYLQKYTVLGQRKFLIYDCKIKKLEAGAGFHAWHYENGDYLSCGRTFVVQTYLNDDFDGGETEFLYLNKREKASTGDVIIFPCQYTHTHRGNPPLGGTKYLATSWGWIQPTPNDTVKFENNEK